VLGTETYDVAVVGLGAIGSAAACHVAGRGLRVLGIDRHSPPHALGSSHGRTRIIREAYFEHPLYVPLVRRAYELWAALERESGRPLLRIVGGLNLGRPDSALVAGARRSVEQHGVPHAVLQAAEVAADHPALRPDPGMVAIREARAGILEPEACVAAHLQVAAARGAALRQGEPVLRWSADDDGVTVITARGAYRARRLILAAGPWLHSLVPDLRLPLTVERQVQFWFEPREPTDVFAPERCPVHLWELDGGRWFYGFPDLGHGVKLAMHHGGAVTDPERVRRDVGEDEIAALRTLVRRYVPAADGRLLDSAVCLYTNTPDGHFWIDAHPAHSRVLVVSACSGHGFKFASALGEIVADLVTTGAAAFDLTPFRAR
jgi:sarcosine oxidase